MAKLTEYKDMNPRAKAVVEGIAQARGIDPANINNVWKALARHPAVMEAFAAEMKAAFAPGKLDPLTKELVYLAVSITNQCEYCIHGRRPGRAEGQQDRHGLSRARRRCIRGEVIVNDVKAPIWDANLYLKFADARLRPALDLMGRLDPANGARPGHAIYDLGCGAGNISRILAERFPAAPIVGIDSSEEMLAKARGQTADRRVTFTTGDLAHFKPGLPPSILYSNAAYQWVEGHIDMFPGLLKLLPSGGQLAIQMPRNHEAPSHALMRQAAQAGPWRDKLAKVGGIRSVFEPGRYYDVLKPLCSDLDVWESIYQQVLTGKDPVAQYTAGTGLRPYMAVLDEAERTGFYDTYAKLLAEAYPMRSDGITLFPFRRLFIVARRA